MRLSSGLSLSFAALIVALSFGVPSASAQSRVVDITVHSPGLEHNLLGDPADQPVSVYLPDAYSRNPQQRLPVLYFLHGYSDTTPRHQAAEEMGRSLEQAIVNGSAQPFILVLPNGLNKYLGSFYANSSTTGNWDDFVTRDVVGYVDAHFRTETGPEHRAIAGHSMGGYGALTLAFRHPDVFGSVYALSPCCTALVADFGPSNADWRTLNAFKSPAEVPAALYTGHFFAAADAALDAALAPDPATPTFGDPPFVVRDGALVTSPQAFSRIAMNLPVNMVFPLLPNLAKLRGIAIDYGAQDNFSHIPLGAQELASRLSQAGISYSLEVYQGDHGNHIAERIGDHLLPWASAHLANSR